MKKLFFTLAFTLIGLAPHQTYTMQVAAGRTAGQIVKHFAKKGFSGFMSALHWGIAAGPFMYGGKQRVNTLINEEKYLLNYNNANEEVTHFIKNEIEQLSPDNPLVGVKVENNPFFTTPVAAFKKNIALSASAHDVIAKALEENNSQELNKWKSALQHENTHRDKNDTETLAAVILITPFATHGSLRILHKVLPFAKKAPSFWKDQIKKIPTGIGKLYLNILAYTSVSRYIENRADNGIKNDVQSLNGHKDFLSEFEEIEKKKNAISGLDKHPTAKKIQDLLSTHPPISERIENANQRLTALEKEQWNQQIQEVRENYQNMMRSSTEQKN